MKGNKDWDIPETEGDFTLIEEIDVLSGEDLEIEELTDTVEFGKEKPSEKDDFVSILDEDTQTSEGSVIEPSTMIEEEITQKTEDEMHRAFEHEEEKVKKVSSEESVTSEPAREVEKLEQELAKEGEEVTREAEKFVLESNAAEKTEVVNKEEETSMQTRFKQEEINAALKNFVDISPDFIAAAIVSVDGFVIASVLPENVEENKLGAMAAAILSLGERAVQELEKGNLETVFVEGENGYVLLSSVNPEILLVVSTTKYAKLGLVFYELSSLKKTIKSLFE